MQVMGAFVFFSDRNIGHISRTRKKKKDFPFVGWYIINIVSKKSHLRPFLMQSDSASRKRRFLTGLFFDWILLVLLLVVSQVDFLVFMLLLEAVGMREYYCCTAVEIGWQLCASRFLREQRLDESSSERVGGFGLRRKSPKATLSSWSCTQPRAAKVTADAAVVVSIRSKPRVAAVV